MTIGVEVSIAGLAEMEKAIKRLRDEMQGKEGNITSLALRAASKDVARRMSAFAPQSARGSHVDWHMSRNGKWTHGGEDGERADPGRLKRSIFLKRLKARHLSEVFVVGPKAGDNRNDPTGAWYAAIVEFKGGRGGRGKGFMRRSLDPSIHGRMIAFEMAKRILTKAKKIGDQNLAEVANAVKRANAGFAYKK